MTTSVQQHRALRLLADAPHGRTVADLLAHGFTNALLDRLARDGLATIQPGTICTSTRRITIVWVGSTVSERLPTSGWSSDTQSVEHRLQRHPGQEPDNFRLMDATGKILGVFPKNPNAQRR